MVAYLYRMPAGIPGEIASHEGAYIEPQELTPAGTANAPDAYGIPVVIDATSFKIRKVIAADTAIYGLLVRPYPANAAQDALGVGTPSALLSGDIMRRGTMTVLLAGSTAAVKGGQVYVWTAAATGSHIVGGFESTNPTTSGIAIPATFMGPADANGNVVINFNI